MSFEFELNRIIGSSTDRQRLISGSHSVTDEARSTSRRPREVLHRLYVSHFLSTWNSRMFEFGAFLFLASTFSGTLRYASVYALVRSLAVAILSSWIGALVDRSNRLVVLRLSIVWQRVPVAISCLCFMSLLARDSERFTVALFSVVVMLACMEKLAAAVNTVAVERDWVIVISESLEIPRQDLNASIRRIDLFCKLFAPVFISLVHSFATKAAIWTVFGLNAASVVVEYLAIAQVHIDLLYSVHLHGITDFNILHQVYQAVPELIRDAASSEQEAEVPSVQSNNTLSTMQKIILYVQNAAQPWREYVSSPVFLASFALSMLYLTVLSFSGQMITYLLHVGFSSLEVSCMRVGAVISELAGTWAAPMAMRKLGPVRSGLWFIDYQLACLASAAVAFVYLDSTASWLCSIILVVGVALSRLGLWGFDLAVQFLVQENTHESVRARFSSTEMAVQNIFELLSFASTIAFARPEQFKWPVFISFGVIAVAATCFAAYVRKERGHLLHTSKCLGDAIW
ncbi:hypothetical protein K474DRAFT_1687515 [Panus rudis PR-1116 ss-1]|nr:hypothetical protein K474DRAFT_1687515 [Panus rudis PR-1116 ss-1]